MLYHVYVSMFKIWSNDLDPYLLTQIRPAPFQWLIGKYLIVPPSFFEPSMVRYCTYFWENEYFWENKVT